ncbi:hypothetical protein BPTFM16_02393 [Altererythrobacter insulae]|nr:hypothetical protein BPTFM16_02393 [Altererythrobacter insulae]
MTVMRRLYDGKITFLRQPDQTTPETLEVIVIARYYLCTGAKLACTPPTVFFGPLGRSVLISSQGNDC